MKRLALLIVSLFLVTGCASFQDAYYSDREFGQASQATWDAQVTYTDYRHTPKTPETIEGITAEEIMDVYNETFAEEPEDVDVITLGLED